MVKCFQTAAVPMLFMACNADSVGYPVADSPLSAEEYTFDGSVEVPCVNESEAPGTRNWVGLVATGRRADGCGQLSEVGVDEEGLPTGDIDTFHFMLLEPATVITWVSNMGASPVTFAITEIDDVATSPVESTWTGVLAAGVHSVTLAGLDGSPAEYMLTVEIVTE